MPDDLKPLVAFLKKAARQSYSSSSTFTSGSKHENFINSSKQQCTVKLRYSENLQAHAKYLKNYMVQKDKDEVSKKPELFGNVSREEYIKRMAKAEKNVYKNGKQKTIKTSRHFKWILSPEENLSEEVLKEYTKCFVQRLEQATGYKFVWQAAIHTDTAHNHVHLLINGVDMNGNVIKGFSKDLIKNYAREFSQEILTRMCGNRDPELKRKARANRCYAERWTEFDQVISDMCIKDKDKEYIGHIGKVDNKEIKTRLDFLQSLNLADIKDGKYYIKKDFEEKLRAFGRYNTFREAQSYVKNGENMKLYTKEMGNIKGTIRKVYSMNDEDIWNNGIVLENEETGESYYVPSFNPVNKKVGQHIKIVTKKDEGGKEHIKFENIQAVENESGFSYTD